MTEESDRKIVGALECEDLSPLIELLRSDRPIDRMVRDAVADLFDEKSSSEFSADLKRRRPGKPRDPYIYSKEHYIGWTIDILVSRGDPVESAVAAACTEYDCNRSYAYKALRSYREWWQASLPLNLSENPRSLPLHWRPKKHRSSKKP